MCVAMHIILCRLPEALWPRLAQAFLLLDIMQFESGVGNTITSGLVERVGNFAHTSNMRIYVPQTTSSEDVLGILQRQGKYVQDNSHLII